MCSGNSVKLRAEKGQPVQVAVQELERLSVLKTNHAICWIVIYLVDSVIHLANNPELV